METSWTFSKFTGSRAATCQSHFPYCLYSFHTMWHLPQFCRRAIAKPQTIAWLLMDEFFCPIPRLKILSCFWFKLYKLFHLFFSEKVIAPINGLVAYTY